MLKRIIALILSAVILIVVVSVSFAGKTSAKTAVRTQTGKAVDSLALLGDATNLPTVADCLQNGTGDRLAVTVDLSGSVKTERGNNDSAYKSQKVTTTVSTIALAQGKMYGHANGKTITKTEQHAGKTTVTFSTYEQYDLEWLVADKKLYVRIATYNFTESYTDPSRADSEPTDVSKLVAAYTAAIRAAGGQWIYLPDTSVAENKAGLNKEQVAAVEYFRSLVDRLDGSEVTTMSALLRDNAQAAAFGETAAGYAAKDLTIENGSADIAVVLSDPQRTVVSYSAHVSDGSKKDVQLDLLVSGVAATTIQADPAGALAPAKVFASLGQEGGDQ